MIVRVVTGSVFTVAMLCVPVPVPVLMLPGGIAVVGMIVIVMVVGMGTAAFHAAHGATRTALQPLP